MATGKNNLRHLEWSIRSRARNQDASLRLLEMLHKYEDTWKTQKYSRAAQDLIAVSFSLWRAAFLAEKTSKRADVFSHGRAFLKKVIEDNAISYPTDKGSCEWTFNYYTRNARSSLEELSTFWPQAAPKYEGAKRTPTERWDYCQSLLDKVLTNFEKLLEKRAADAKVAQHKKITREKGRKRRKKIRAMVLASRRS